MIESLKRAGFDADLGEGVLIRKDQRVEAMYLLIQEQLPKGDISICACGGHRPEDPNDSNRDINGDLEAAVGMLPNVSKATISLKMEYFKKADFHLTIDTVDGGPLAQEEIAGIENLFRAYLLPKDDLVIHYTNLRNR